MKKKVTSNNLIIGSAIAATGIAAYLFLRNRKKKLENNTNNAITENSAVNTNTVNKPSASNLPSVTIVNDSFPLKKGSKGTNVTLWQKFLHDRLGNEFPASNIIGTFGPLTEDATKKVTGEKTVPKIMFDAFWKRYKAQSQTSVNPFTSENANNWLKYLGIK
jgi:hypothetical protein